nr:MAG TPA: hypothetical protein [Caudoviricetes sp.]
MFVTIIAFVPYMSRESFLSLYNVSCDFVPYTYFTSKIMFCALYFVYYAYCFCALYLL